MQKTFFGLFVLLLIGGVVFSYSYFSFGEIMMREINRIMPDFSAYNNFEEKDEDGDEEEDEVRSPGPLVKDNDNAIGFLTREGVIRETNRQRERFNADALTENEKLNEVARIKLDDMFEKQYFAHVSPTGIGVGDIAKEKQYDYLLVGDNLAMGNYQDDEDVVNAWMNSPGHRKNILEEKYEEIGVAARKGVYNNKEIWMVVQVFAMPPDACPAVDQQLITEIERKEGEAEKMLQEREDLRAEIDAIRPRGSEEHVEKVEEYNNLVNDYNNLVAALDNLIDEYNRQVKARTECIRR